MKPRAARYAFLTALTGSMMIHYAMQARHALTDFALMAQAQTQQDSAHQTLFQGAKYAILMEAPGLMTVPYALQTRPAAVEAV